MHQHIVGLCRAAMLSLVVGLWAQGMARADGGAVGESGIVKVRSAYSKAETIARLKHAPRAVRAGAGALAAAPRQLPVASLNLPRATATLSLARMSFSSGSSVVSLPFQFCRANRFIALEGPNQTLASCCCCHSSVSQCPQFATQDSQGPASRQQLRSKRNGAYPLA